MTMGLPRPRAQATTLVAASPMMASDWCCDSPWVTAGMLKVLTWLSEASVSATARWSELRSTPTVPRRWSRSPTREPPLSPMERLSMWT